jgi:hypothetical protein
LGTLLVGQIGNSAELSNTLLGEGSTLAMTITGNSGCLDFRFAVGYTQ